MHENSNIIKDQIISWGQYVHWADVNLDRFLELDHDATDSVKIAILAQWLASEYVALEGWYNMKETCPKVDAILSENQESIDLLKRFRNAVYHFQNKPLDKRLVAFAKDSGRIIWAAELHKRFLEYLIDYPNYIYPYEHRKEDFIESFFSLIGWTPNVVKNTEQGAAPDLSRRFAALKAGELGRYTI